MVRISLISTLAAVALAGVAGAADRIVIDVAAVDFDDPAQAAAVYEKIVEASESVCSDLQIGSIAHRGDLASQRRSYAACVAQTVAETIAEAKRPALESEHAARDAEAFILASQ